MGTGGQHSCSSVAFEAFPEAALDASIPDRFAEQVRRHRDCVALVDKSRSYTYGELDQWSNGVAHAIVDETPATHDPVALLVRQGAAYAAAVIATLKTGRPYVPLDPADPEPRLRHLVEACGATAMVVEDATRQRVVAPGASIVDVDSAPRLDAPDCVVDADTIAYVFFTSGSTGESKGVYDTHRNVLHNVLRYTDALRIAPGDRLTLLQGPAFSGCVSSQFGALLNGAASLPFRLADEGLVRAAEWLREERATIYHSVPAIFRAIVARGGSFPDVRVVRLEGDRATAQDVELWRSRFAPASVLANGLGTTETGLARQLVVRQGDRLPPGLLAVGHAVRDVDAFLVGADREPLADGEVGEIAIASDFLALGYWNRPDLTAERFGVRDDTRVYFTGDLGRMSDGCLEYLGRLEADVKVLGVRVEPAEVERELLRLEGVREAAVAIREGTRGEGRVVAYVVPQRAGEVELASLRAALSEHLPTAQLPTALVELAELPLGASGKVDRRALPDPPEARGRDDVSTGDAERIVSEIWADVLGLRVGANDDFFALGGDSLAAAEIVARIELEAGVRLPASILAGAPTVAELADALGRARSNGSSSVVVLGGGVDGAPLYLLHGKTGNALRYTGLARTLGRARPLRAFEYVDTDDFRVESIASRHVDVLLDVDPDGPYHLAGFCYGAVIAREMAVRLAAEGRDVSSLALLGITPLDFPTLVTPAARSRWEAHVGPGSALVREIRRHVRRASELPRADGARYLARRGANLLRRPARRRHYPHLRAVADALAAYAPGSYAGSALVILHDEDTAPYTDDPQRDWAGLAAHVEVTTLPGRDHAMLEEPGVEALSDLLQRHLPRRL